MYENHMCELRSEESRWKMIIRVTHATFAVAKRKTEKKIQAGTGFASLTSAGPVQRSTN